MTAKTILAIDTCGAQCSVALAAYGALVGRDDAPMSKGHAEALGPMIERLLAASGTSYQELDAIAVTTGPGPFTGVRVGLSVARGLAIACGCPVIGLSVFDLAAFHAADQLGDQPCCIIVEGRAGSVFWQRFTGDYDATTGLAIKDGEPGNDPEGTVLARNKGTQILHTGPIDCGQFALLAAALDPHHYPAEPLYVRAPDAAPANPLFHVG